MRNLDPDVFVGRDPAWKEAWEDILTKRQRSQVRRAVTRGKRLDDPELEPFVAGLVARERRNLPWKSAVFVGMILLWLFAGIVSRSSLSRWYYMGLAAVLALGGTVSFLLQRTWLTRAERVNLSRPNPRD